LINSIFKKNCNFYLTASDLDPKTVWLECYQKELNLDNELIISVGHAQQCDKHHIFEFSFSQL